MSSFSQIFERKFNKTHWLEDLLSSADVEFCVAKMLINMHKMSEIFGSEIVRNEVKAMLSEQMRFEMLQLAQQLQITISELSNNINISNIAIRIVVHKNDFEITIPTEVQEILSQAEISIILRNAEEQYQRLKQDAFNLVMHNFTEEYHNTREKTVSEMYGVCVMNFNDVPDVLWNGQQISPLYTEL